MAMKVLITGGAGFIGSHLADELLRVGHEVRVLDNLLSQVHDPGQRAPAYLNEGVELCVGDVRDPAAVERALTGVEAVYHFAARVGVGQSMYEMAEYTEVNNQGTAVLLQALVRQPIRRLVVASSMSVYGEGLYRPAGGNGDSRGSHGREVPSRPLAQLKRGEWELCDEKDQPLVPVPTPETKSPALESVYALSKYHQERMCLVAGRAYGIPTVALRFFNVYGPRQALSNPYTGVLAIFASRLLNGRPPLIFEDGRQQRDFVSVYDVVEACRLALDKADVAGEVLNIGSGEPRTILEVATTIAKAVGQPNIVPSVTGRYRMGDVRHCFADISRAQAVLGYAPRHRFADGLEDLVKWLDGKLPPDRTSHARAELDARGLTI
jgi:dTDP-L-rhamnose 4-epimerase